jgi:CRP-like cAMP-binding protein
MLNGLIAQLDEKDQALIMKVAKLVDLIPGENLSAKPKKDSLVYFPVSGSIALMASIGADDRLGVAVGLIGSNGAAGLHLAMGFESSHLSLLVQSAGQAYAIDSQAMQALVKTRKNILFLVARYLCGVCDSIAIFAAHRYTQDIKVRLAYWLLLSAECCSPEPLKLKHSQIAQMLGVRRASISIAARELKLKRYVSYSRGQVRLLNLSALQSLAGISP